MNSQEALDLIEASPTLPDLILLDCMMPGMSGHEFVAKLRTTVPRSVVPVIMVSAKTNEDNIVEGLQSGCNDFIRCVVLTMIFIPACDKQSCVPIAKDLSCWATCTRAQCGSLVCC